MLANSLDAQVLAKFLTESGYSNIPIGIGVPTDLPDGPLFSWAADFNLSSYKKLEQDGITAAVNIIMQLGLSGEAVDIVAIAPATNFPSLLQLEPGLWRL